MDPNRSHRGPYPKRLKTFAFGAARSEGNNLLHQFVLDNSDPNDSGSESYINAVLMSMAGTPVDVNALNAEGYSPLHLAVMKNNVLMVRKLLSCLVNMDVSTRSAFDEGFDSALHLAAKFGHLPMIQELLNEDGTSVDANAHNAQFYSPLHLAVLRNDVLMVRELLSCVVNINVDEDFGDVGDSALLLAARLGRSSIVRELLNKGADVNYQNLRDCTALCYAAASGDLDVIELLVKKGADVNVHQNKVVEWTTKDFQRHGTPLHSAAENGRIEAVKFLVSNGAALDAVEYDDETVLFYAVKSGDLATVEFIVSCGVDINAKNYERCTPLHSAVNFGNKEIVKFLVSNGADLNAKDKNGYTLLHLLIIRSNSNSLECFYDTEMGALNKLLYCSVIEHSQERLDVMEMLLNNGSDIDAKDRLGKTPLHMAVCTANFVYAESLLERSACVNTADIDGWTPLHAAAHINHVQIIRWLVDKGADKNAKNNDGKTPLDLAKENKHELSINALQ